MTHEDLIAYGFVLQEEHVYTFGPDPGYYQMCRWYTYLDFELYIDTGENLGIVELRYLKPTHNSWLVCKLWNELPYFFEKSQFLAVMEQLKDVIFFAGSPILKTLKLNKHQKKLAKAYKN